MTEKKPSNRPTIKSLTEENEALKVKIDEFENQLSKKSVEGEPGTEPKEFFDENTHNKVYWAIARAGLSDVMVTRVINELQNKGILFRERA